MSARTLIRRFVVVLPVALASVALPVAQRTGAPDVRQWRLPVDVAAVPIEAPGDFGLVGVTWPAGSDPVQTVSVRTSLDGVRWDDWQALDVDGTPAAGRRISSSPLWVGRARFVAVHFAPGMPGGADVRLIDPGTGPATPASTAMAATERPAMISRAGWGADESIRKGRPGYASKLRNAIVHHTASGNTYSPSESAGIVRGIYTYHVRTNGWNDIGYNFLIDKYGQVFEGRAGGVDKAVVAAHSGGFNTGSTGVAVIGTFGDASPPTTATSALRRLLAWKLDVHHVDPTATIRVTSGGSSRYPAGQTISLPTISGHRQVSNTECPGNGLYNKLSKLREDVRATGLPKIYDPAFSLSAFTPNEDGTADTTRFTARLDGATSWTLRVVSPLGKEVLRRTGTGTSVSFSWNGHSPGGPVQRHGSYRFLVDASTASGARALGAEARVLLASWPDGSVLQGSGREIYLVRANRLQRFTSMPALLSHYRSDEVADVSDAAVAAYPKSGTVGFRDGALLRTPDGRVWLVSDGERRWIRSGTDLNRLGLQREAIVSVTNSQAQVHPQGQPVDPDDTTLPDGMLARGTASSAVYWITEVQRRHVPSRNVLTTWFAPEEVARVNDVKINAHPLGPTLGFREGTLVKTSTDSRVWVISGDRRRHITSGATLSALGFDRDNIRSATQTELNRHAEGPPV